MQHLQYMFVTSLCCNAGQNVCLETWYKCDVPDMYLTVYCFMKTCYYSAVNTAQKETVIYQCGEWLFIMTPWCGNRVLVQWRATCIPRQRGRSHTYTFRLKTSSSFDVKRCVAVDVFTTSAIILLHLAVTDRCRVIHFGQQTPYLTVTRWKIYACAAHQGVGCCSCHLHLIKQGRRKRCGQYGHGRTIIYQIKE